MSSTEYILNGKRSTKKEVDFYLNAVGRDNCYIEQTPKKIKVTKK